ncbi:MAG: hypothetical protein AUI92_03170 [Thaumarchaeota archaeon 13_1_40CM_3_38_6]|nr:MAG: hypothetical protein AUI92_03170 [Thaumarchaeota archaeon 13_1_40CM_3_38_6]
MSSTGSVSFDRNDDAPDDEWNERLLKSEFGTIFQTTEYGKYEELIQKSEPKYYKFRDKNDAVVGQILLFKQSRGKGKLTKFIPRISLTWTHGPVVLNDSYYNEISAKLCNFLSSKNFQGSPHPQDKKFVFQDKYNFEKQDAATFIIDLNQRLEDIFKNTDKKSVQKNIERSRDRGVTINEFTINDDDDVKNYSVLLNEHRKSNDLLGYSHEQVKEVLKLATSKGTGAGFLAWYKKKPIGGIFISAFNRYINEWGIARDKTDTDEKLYAQDLLRWTIIEWGKKNGCRFYDLSGFKYPVSKQSQKEKGIYQNKKKWGGKETVYTIFKH